MQFAEGEDLETYPRDEEGDLLRCEKLNVDAVYIPTSDEMYPKGMNREQEWRTFLWNVLPLLC